jgi:hypothetical protein
MSTAKILSAILFVLASISSNAQEYNPFKSIGKKGKILTLSKGKYVEVFDYDTVQRIGTVLFNIKTKKIVKLLNAEEVNRKFSDNSSASRWYSPDPLAYKYFSLSPYNFVANNPIINIDPDGREIVGVTKDDAKKFQENLNTMLKDKGFDQFRSLVALKGKSFKAIDQAAFDKATEGMSADQKAFAQTVFNTINSKDVHSVEYVSSGGNLSTEGSNLLNDKAGGVFTKTMENNDGKLPGTTVAGIWGATTLKTKDGSYSVIIEGLTPEQAGTDYLNSTTNTKGGNPAGTAGTAGHEVFGHGRFAATNGEDASAHHVNAIRMENLILRVMGFGNTQRTGEAHGTKTVVTDASSLPKL